MLIAKKVTCSIGSNDYTEGNSMVELLLWSDRGSSSSSPMWVHRVGDKNKRK